MRQIPNLALPAVRILKPILARLVVLEGLVQLLICIEHERPSRSDRLIQRLSSQHDEAGVVFQHIEDKLLITGQRCGEDGTVTSAHASRTLYRHLPLVAEDH